jgi:hypothetical protein
MKQRLIIFLGFIFLIFLLVGLNAASYVQKQTLPDNEFEPNRSSYNTGATGTRAFYELLAATGHKVTRWQEEPSALLRYDQTTLPSTFVVIGDLRRKFTDEEVEDLMKWVSNGGRLVLIDRTPSRNILKTTANWKIIAIPDNKEFPPDLDPFDSNQMTAKTEAAKPVQPSLLVTQINAVQPSRLASTVLFERNKDNSTTVQTPASPTPTPEDYEIQSASPPEDQSFKVDPESDSSNKEIIIPDKPVIKGEPIRPAAVTGDETDYSEPELKSAPVVHLANDDKIILSDMPYGYGEIVYLSDPYIVANGGIRLADNAQLAINIVKFGDGVVAFDEFHQGYGRNENRLLSYFAGTPVAAIILQLALLIGLILFSQSRRFARALPADESDRLSKLEYIGAMAELQRRTKAFDLALENIYKDFRRRVSRLAGLDATTVSHRDLAFAIVERIGGDVTEIEQLLFKAEDISHGEPSNKKEVTNIVKRLREIEEKLGLQRAKRREKRI